MPPVTSKPHGFSRLISAVFLFVSFAIGTAPALAQPAPLLTLAKTPDGGSVVAGGTATFTIILDNATGADETDIVLQDSLPASVLDWAIVSDNFGCSIAGPPGLQVLSCVPVPDILPNETAFTVVVSGTAPTQCGLLLQNTANVTYGENGTEVSDTGDITVRCGRPLFVIGDTEPHAVDDVVNFWGSQWWKNNGLSGPVAKGVASFKGYASDSDSVCGGEWESRVGNSPPPPDTIPDVIQVIVTNTVGKDGPDIVGRIVEIVEVLSDGGYGPAPGHRGNGRVTKLVCSTPAPSFLRGPGKK